VSTIRKAIDDARRTIAPRHGDPHGPLPGLLVALTVVTGLVDAFSYLELGRVFVANMTGNVVFLSFSLGGAPGFLWWASALAIAAFFVGAFLGGRLAATHRCHRGRHLRLAATAQTMLVLAATIAAILFAVPYGDPAIVVLVILLGVGMGLQNATARSLAVPDLTTTVLTLTITGISADNRAAGGPGSRVGRRTVSILALFVGGLIGALLWNAGIGWCSMLAATVLLAIVVIVANRTSRSTEEWAHKPGR